MSSNDLPNNNGASEKLLQKHGLLEEMNLPPRLIRFIRDNAKALQVGGIVLVVIVLGWIFWDSYAESQRDESSYSLYQAMQAENQSRIDELNQVVEKYSGTNAALWSRIEQADLAYAKGNYEEALQAFEKINRDVSSGSALKPLVRFSLARSYEKEKEFDKALKMYEQLAVLDGFKIHGLLGKARIHELQEDPEKALAAYRQANELDVPAGPTQEFISYKIEILEPPAGGEE